MLGILTTFAEFDRKRIWERRAEGIVIVKTKRKYVQQHNPGVKEVEQAQAMIDREVPKTQDGATLEISRQPCITRCGVNRRNKTKFREHFVLFYGAHGNGDHWVGFPR